MTGDASPENLRKFLESDDPSMIGMGLSMAKGSADASKQTLGLILGLYMFHGDKGIRSLARTAFTKLAPSVPKGTVRKYWQAEFRTQPWVWEGGWMQKMVSEIDEAGINPVYLLIRAFVAGDEGTRGVIIGILEKIEVVDDSAIVVAALVQMISEVKRWNRGPLTNEKAAITIIENIGGEQAVDALAGLLGNNLEINEVVADTLGTLGDVRAVEPLISVLSNDSEAVARTLGILGDARAVGPLIKILGEIFDRPRPPNHYYYVHRFSLLDKDISAFIEALIKLDDTHAVELLIKALDDKEDNDAVLRGFRRGAAEALGNIGDARAVEPLIKALGEDKSEVRWPAAGALGKIGDKRAVDPLIEVLGDDDESVNSSAAEALGEIGDARAVEPLIKALGNESWKVCEAAAKALGKIGGKRAVEPLIEALGNEDEDVKSSAAEALGKIGDARAVEQLVKVLGDESWSVCKAAAKALGKISDRRAVEPLIGALGNGYWQVRQHVAEALGEIGDTRAVEPLIELLEDDEDIREAAKEALKKLGHEVE